MSSVVNAFVHAIHKRSKKCLAQKVVRFGSLGLIPMIQIALELLYKMSLEPMFSFERFPRYKLLNIGAKITHQRIYPVYNALVT